MGIKNRDLKIVDGYYRALNYLSVGQLYLKDNPLLKRELNINDVKTNVIGHWGTCPGQNMIYAHLNRIITEYELNMIYLSGPGHGGNAPTSGAYLDGTISDCYPEISEDEAGMTKLFKRFSFPGGVSSHASPELPGSIHEGGELGYSLAHAFGAVLDNPNLIAAAVIGDGEAETGPLACSWNLNKFLNINTDGVVLPIIHLNGFKINNPSILSRTSYDRIMENFSGLGYKPYFVDGEKSMDIHKKLAKVFDQVISDIKNYKSGAKAFKEIRYPMIILRTPKGMTGPKDLVGTSDSHQVPFQVRSEEDVIRLERWLKSYKPNELFDESGKLSQKYRMITPIKRKTMSSNSHANGGKFLKDLHLPKVDNHELKFDKKGCVKESDMMHLGGYLKEVFDRNAENKNFRIFGPDEAMSNRFNKVFESVGKMWNTNKYDSEVLLQSNGRVLDGVLSEHLCEGALEGYVLTGRHGIMHSYEAFIRVVDSMASQHAKWLKMCSEISWREDISSLNYILSSHAWQQDHNGYTHQEPGFISHILTKKPEFVKVYLPSDANTLVVSVDDALKSRNKINAIVASKHPKDQWFSMEEAKDLLSKGIDVISWASNEVKKPDVILACAGDTPSGEMFIAAKILEEKMPNLKVKVINVLNLMKLVSKDEYEEGLDDKEFNDLFTKNTPVIFSFHGYTSLIKSLVYDRDNKNFTVLGYNEEGTITTPFDMRVLNKIDRYNIILTVLSKVSKKNASLEQECIDVLEKHRKHIAEFGKDLDEVVNFDYNKVIVVPEVKKTTEIKEDKPKTKKPKVVKEKKTSTTKKTTKKE